MKINEIISEVLNNTIKQDGRKKTQTDIATALGVKPQIVNDRLKNENMKVNTAIEMLAEMGYEIVVRPAEASDKRESYVVEKGGMRVR
jgi:predicted XRE-type DNA-binding protein